VFRSLDNTSNVVRWSLDLRWQHPDLPDGAFGLKRPIVMTRGGQPPAAAAGGSSSSSGIDWGNWADIDKKTGKKTGSAEGLAAVDQAAGEGEV